jgi:hypothetical protein
LVDADADTLEETMRNVMQMHDLSCEWEPYTDVDGCEWHQTYRSRAVC